MKINFFFFSDVRVRRKNSGGSNPEAAPWHFVISQTCQSSSAFKEHVWKAFMHQVVQAFMKWWWWVSPKNHFRFIYGNNWLICNRNLKTSLSLTVYFCGFWIAWAFLCFIYRSVPCKFCLCTRVSERDFPLITSDGKALNSIREQRRKKGCSFKSRFSSGCSQIHGF